MELAIVGGLAATSIYYRFTINYRRKRKVIKAWNELMEELKLYSKKSNYIPQIIEVNFIGNGYILTIHIPTGLSLGEVEKYKETIENKFKGIVTIENIKFSSLVKVKVINKDIGNFKFEPVRALDNQIYLGKKLDGENYLIDINNNPHLLIAGQTGTGKTYLLASIITNLEYNSSKYIELYLCQTAKQEIGFLANLKSVKFNAKTLGETSFILDNLVKKIQNRSELFTSNGIRNLSHWNRKFKSRRMKRIYCVIEELSCYMPDESDNEEEKELKAKCWSNILKIVKLGRSSGIHFIGIVQRSTVSNLGGNGDIKSQMTRVTFRQASTIDSQNIIGNNMAIDLTEREIVTSTTDGYIQCKAPWIDEDFTILNKYVPEIVTAKNSLINKDSLLNKKPIDCSNGVARELPLYITKTENKVDENEIATTKVIKKKIRKGVIRED